MPKVSKINSPRMVLFGEGKVGKTTFCSQLPNVYFLCSENGLSNFEGIDYEDINSLSDLRRELDNLLKGEKVGDFDYSKVKNVVLDSIDALDSVLLKELPALYGAKSLSDGALSYNQWRIYAAEKWQGILNTFDLLWKKGIGIYLIGHAREKKIEGALQDAHKRVQLQIGSEKAGEVIVNWADIMALCYSDYLVSQDGKVVDGTQKSVMALHRDPAFTGGCRYDFLPAEIEFTYQAFQKAWSDGINKKAKQLTLGE